MKTFKAVLNSPYFFWAILCLPAIPMMAMLLSDNPRAIHRLVHPTGEFAARFMIIVMMLTPLVMRFRQNRFLRWLMKQRRHISVAAFGYAAAQTLFYLIDGRAIVITVSELSKLYVWTGWMAFLLFLPLAIISTDGWVRSLCTKWKTLHDWGGVAPSLVHFARLLALEARPVWYNFNRLRHSRSKNVDVALPLL